MTANPRLSTSVRKSAISRLGECYPTNLHIVMWAEESTDEEEFWKHLGGKGAIKSAADGGSDEEPAFTKKLFRFAYALPGVLRQA